jgi:NADH-quinone oxidoreductase subunit L
VGWELVGLCSYLLIGYYYEKKSAGDAGKKAFITNRVGDFGVVLAVMMIFFFLGTVDFTEVFEKAPHTFEYGGIIVTLIALFLFMGAAGKSAQIPLYVWLPDAMEGPTPVSALIHAATMVTAGVYMIARCAQIFILAPTALMVVAIVGALTALYAATIGLLQNDIKKVLAYSTISQLGYMFIAVGVASFAAGIFHLMTHSFFKACLFLGSGSVIHAMSGEQDMRKMGALRKHMPWTFWTFLISTMAIAGFPPLSGFFSKDEILWKAFSGEHGHPLIWLVGAIAAGLTAFYMFRLVFMTFFGKSRVAPEAAHHLHESPKTMTMPLAILAFLALFGGFIGMPHIFGVENKFEKWLEPAIHVTVPVHAEKFASAAPGGHETVSDETINSEHDTGHGEVDVHAAGTNGNAGLEWLMMIVSVIIALAGFLVAFIMYIKSPHLPGKLAQKAKGLYNVVYNKYFVDEIYQATAIEGTYKTSRFFSWFDGKVIDGVVNFTGGFTLLISQIDNLIDKYIVDGLVNGLGAVTRFFGGKIRLIQTGNLQNYIFYVFYGTLLIIIYKIIFQ